MTRTSVLPESANKSRAVEEMFDRIAPRYDALNRALTFRMDVGWRNAAVASLDLKPGSRVLDLACGTGDLCRTLAAAGHEPVGVDFSAGMLGARHTDAPVVRADALRLPFPTAAFAGVTCGFALRNFVDVDAVFGECARVLCPGGRFAALDAAVPTNPILRAGNAVWFRGAVPLLGRLVAHDTEAYRYLPKSTAYLPPLLELATRLERAGFREVRHTTLTGGSVLLLTGTRR